MKTTLYKLKEGYVLCSDEDIKDNDIVLVNKKWHDNVLRIFTTVFGGTKEGCKKVLTQSPDFSLLSEEDAKKIGLFDVDKIADVYFEKMMNDGRGFELNFGWRNRFLEIFKFSQELTADRRFTEEDMIQAFNDGMKNAWKTISQKILPEEYIQSLSQHKSWEVEYKEENGVYKVTKIL
jgi:hypothetical protein